VFQRRKTPTIRVGNISIGSDHPIVIQSMTNTPTANIDATVQQVKELIAAGSEMVRLTINNNDAAKAIPTIIQRLRDKDLSTPIIGDFHFNGHILLQKHPECARLLGKYRINPGNVGKGEGHNNNFAQIIKIAIEHDKPVRIGVNYGSLDTEMFTRLMDENAQNPHPQETQEITYEAMIQSALASAACAEELGLAKDKIILSVKMSVLQDMVAVYTRLAQRCDYALHLGLTEAGGDVQGISSSSAALAILLQQGIGDTIRVSLTPQPNVSRVREVDVCKALLQSMGLRYFAPHVTSCPGCGRTSSDYFQHLAKDINTHIQRGMPAWKDKYPGIEKLTIAVMGCVVNGPGESRHADIGISLPGASERPIAPVYANGRPLATLKGEHIKEEFIDLLEKYIQNRFNGGASYA